MAFTETEHAVMVVLGAILTVFGIAAGAICAVDWITRNHYQDYVGFTIVGIILAGIAFVVLYVLRALVRESIRWIRTRLSDWHARQKRKPEGGPYR